MQPPYDLNQKRYLTNAVLYALWSGLRTDSKPANPENQLIIIGASSTGGIPTVIDETKRLMGVTEGHPGIGLKPSAVLIRHELLRQALRKSKRDDLDDLDEAITACRAERNSTRPYAPLPQLFTIYKHPLGTYYATPNNQFRPGARRVAMLLLDIALMDDNVKTMANGT